MDYFDLIMNDIPKDEDESISESGLIGSAIGAAGSKVVTTAIGDKIKFPIKKDTKKLIEKKIKLEMKIKKIKEKSPESKDIIEKLESEHEDIEKEVKKKISSLKNKDAEDVIRQYENKCELDFGPRSIFYFSIKIPKTVKEAMEDIIDDDTFNESADGASQKKKAVLDAVEKAVEEAGFKLHISKKSRTAFIKGSGSSMVSGPNSLCLGSQNKDTYNDVFNVVKNTVKEFKDFTVSKDNYFTIFINVRPNSELYLKEAKESVYSLITGEYDHVVENATEDLDNAKEKNVTDNQQDENKDEFAIGAMLPQCGSTKGVGDPNSVVSDIKTLNKEMEDGKLNGIELPDNIEIEAVHEYIQNPDYAYTYYVEKSIKDFTDKVKTRVAISSELRRAVMAKSTAKAKLRVAKIKHVDPAKMNELKQNVIQKEKELRVLKKGLDPETIEALNNLADELDEKFNTDGVDVNESAKELKNKQGNLIKIDAHPLKGINGIKFGMKKSEVSKKIKSDFSKFRKSESSKNTTDDFGFCHVFYNSNDECEAIEIFDDAEVSINGSIVMPSSFTKIKSIIKDLKKDDEGYISTEKSIGVRVSNGQVKSILLAVDGYYSDKKSSKEELEEKLEAAMESNNLTAIKTYENKLKYLELHKPDNMFEAANIDSEIKPVIELLNNKGYKTKYSSAGHVHLRKKEDNYRDGVFYGKLYSDARIMFDGDYDFPKPPKHWVWKNVDNNDYLDIIPIAYDKKNGSPDEAFAKWKKNYMETLRTWVDNLPDQNKSENKVITKDRKGRVVVTESDNDYVYTEAYFGKSGTLIEAEKTLGELIALMKANPLADYTNHPLNIKFTQLLQKQFGFNKVFITWKRTSKVAPAIGTLFCADLVFNGEEIVAVDKKKGYYDKSHRHVCFIQASSTIASQADLTAGEYMAILLHEIGHNFDASFYYAINVCVKTLRSVIQIKPNIVFDPESGTVYQNGTRTSINPWPVILATDPGKKIYSAYTKIIEAILNAVPIFKKIGMALKNFGAWLTRGLEKITAPLNFLAMPLYMLMSPVSHLIAVPEKKGETFADSFAGAYGYGSEIGSSLAKLEALNLIKPIGLTVSEANASLKENSTRKFLTDLAMANRTLLMLFNDGGHGTIQNRIQVNIDMLKKDLATGDYTPEVKKELQKEIDKLENTLSNYLYVADNDKNAKLTFTLFCRQAIYDIFGGHTDYIAKLFPENIVSIHESYQEVETYIENYENIDTESIDEFYSNYTEALLDNLEDDDF